ncbi:hypothetical protein D3C73_1459710 [compost metagenome]
MVGAELDVSKIFAVWSDHLAGEFILFIVPKLDFISRTIRSFNDPVEILCFILPDSSAGVYAVGIRIACGQDDSAIGGSIYKGIESKLNQ